MFYRTVTVANIIIGACTNGAVNITLGIANC